MESSRTEGLSDLQFDMVTILHSKSEGINAYDKYIRDAEQENSTDCVELLQRLKQQDIQAVEEIKQHAIQLLQHGRMQGDRMASKDQQSYQKSVQ